MAENRVEVIGYGEFDPREWLRREVLWASIMAPYSYQMESWLNNTRKALHDGNVSRKEFYDVEGDVELQSLSFFNHGKTIAGPLTSAALFKASMDQPSGFVDILDVQAKSVDKVLSRISVRPTTTELSISANEAFSRCSDLTQLAATKAPANFLREHNLLRAASIMSILATSETRAWTQNSMQNNEGSLPTLVIENGGFPRSAGPKVERLQPIFHQIIESESYLALTA